MNKKEMKNALRQEMKGRIYELSDEYCRNANRDIVRMLMDTSEYKNAETICCYVGTDTEIHTRPLLLVALAEGKQVGVPRCLGKGLMDMVLIECLEDLEEGAFGIMEPKEHRRRMDKKEIQLMIIPCLSCTPMGVRLGYGGGYYDRYLEGIFCPRIVLCRERLLSNHIPKEPYDQPMNLVITEKSVIYC